VNRDVLINHILTLMQLDIDYARYALRQYHAMLPWMDLMSGVREAMKGPQWLS
jgi:hypothetical protein